MTTFQTWPASLSTASIMYHIAPNVRMGPQLANGKQQVVEESSGYLIAETKYDIALEDQVRTYIAMIAKAGGGARGFILLSQRTLLSAPWPAGTGPTTANGIVSLSNDQILAAGQNLTRPVINVQVPTAYAAGTTVMDVLAIDASAPKLGVEFSYFDTYGAKRMAIITEPPVNLGLFKNKPLWRLTFLPALRTNIPAWAQIDFINTGCTMRLAETMTGMLTIESYLSGSSTIKWTEWWPNE